MLHALLERPLPAAEVATDDFLERPLPAAEVATDDGVMLRVQLSTSTMQYEGWCFCRVATSLCRCLTFAVCCAEDAHGNLCVLLPAALLANCRQPVARDMLPVIASQLQQVLQQPDWNRSSWPVMEWLFQDVLLAKLAKCFREAKTATLKVNRNGQACCSGSPWC